MSIDLCPECGWLRDTPMHELGCPVGREEKNNEVVYRATALGLAREAVRRIERQMDMLSEELEAAEDQLARAEDEEANDER